MQIFFPVIFSTSSLFLFFPVPFFLFLFFLLLFLLLPHCYLLSCYFFSCYFFSCYFFSVTFFPVTFFPTIVSTTCWVWKVGAHGDKGITWKLYRENFWSFYPIQTEFDMLTRWECGWCPLSSIEKTNAVWNLTQYWWPCHNGWIFYSILYICCAKTKNREFKKLWRFSQSQDFDIFSPKCGRPR